MKRTKSFHKNFVIIFRLDLIEKDNIREVLEYSFFKRLLFLKVPEKRVVGLNYQVRKYGIEKGLFNGVNFSNQKGMHELCKNSKLIQSWDL